MGTDDEEEEEEAENIGVVKQRNSTSVVERRVRVLVDSIIYDLSVFVFWKIYLMVRGSREIIRRIFIVIELMKVLLFDLFNVLSIWIILCQMI